MCQYTQVEYACPHYRWTVRAWCVDYEKTQIKCKPDVVAIEYRLNENCGYCRPHEVYPIWMETMKPHHSVKNEYHSQSRKSQYVRT